MTADAKVFKNIREVVEFINDNNISRENILNIIDRESQLFLIYYLS